MKGGRLVGSNGAILQTEGFEGGPPEGLRAAPSPQRDSMVARRTGPGGGRGGSSLAPWRTSGRAWRAHRVAGKCRLCEVVQACGWTECKANCSRTFLESGCDSSQMWDLFKRARSRGQRTGESRQSLHDVLFRIASPHDKIQSPGRGLLSALPRGRNYWQCGRGAGDAAGPESGSVGRSLFVPCGKNNKPAPALDRDVQQTLWVVHVSFVSSEGDLLNSYSLSMTFFFSPRGKKNHNLCNHC